MYLALKSSRVLKASFAPARAVAGGVARVVTKVALVVEEKTVPMLLLVLLLFLMLVL
jgi:hypothetical protein